ncbi:MAG: hypothetical protein KAT91_03005 [Candidatus Aenigmarchaeota archaeon]|nr:hypothetical protein [Candidatus Aenigmarchaeota archaeon]
MEELFPKNIVKLNFSDYVGVAFVIFISIFSITFLITSYSSRGANIISLLAYLLIMGLYLYEEYSTEKKAKKYLILDMVPFLLIITLTVASFNDVYSVFISYTLSFSIASIFLFSKQNKIGLGKKEDISKILKKFAAFKRKKLSYGEEFLSTHNLGGVFILIPLALLVSFINKESTVWVINLFFSILIFMCPFLCYKLLFRFYDARENKLGYLMREIKNMPEIISLSVYLDLLKSEIIHRTFPYEKKWSYEEKRISINKAFTEFKKMVYGICIFGSKQDKKWFEKKLKSVEESIISNTFPRKIFTLSKEYKKKEISEVAEWYAIGKYSEFTKAPQFYISSINGLNTLIRTFWQGTLQYKWIIIAVGAVLYFFFHSVIAPYLEIISTLYTMLSSLTI